MFYPNITLILAKQITILQQEEKSFVKSQFFANEMEFYTSNSRATQVLCLEEDINFSV